MNAFPELAQSIQMALKGLQMYTAAHPRSQEALKALKGAMDGWLEERPELQIAASSGKFFVDGAPVEGKSPHLAALCRQLSERQIAGFILRRGIPAEELQAMLDLLLLKPARLEELGGAAKVLAAKNLRFIALSQISYREVREGEGEGDSEETRGPALDAKRVAPDAKREPPEAARAEEPEPLAIDLAEALDHWRQHLDAALLGTPAEPELGTLGTLPAADLSGLGPGALEAGWGQGFPTALQLASLQQVLKGLGGGHQLALLKGMNSLPLAPSSLHAGFQALAPELIAQAATALLAQGIPWQEVRDALHGLLGASPLRQSLLAGLEGAQGLGDGQLRELVQRLDWNGLSLEDKLQSTLEHGQLWILSLDQRLEFLRCLLQEGRQEPFMRLLEMCLEALGREEAPEREAAAKTLAGISHWAGLPEFPLEAEGPLLDGLKGNFGWEPVPPIHRATEEGLAALVNCLLDRGDVGHVLDLVRELEGLLAFMGEAQEWRTASLSRLQAHLPAPAALSKCVEALHKAEPDAVPTIFVPYFEALGETGAAGLIRILGEEPDRKRRGRLLDVIRALGPLALPALAESLKSPVWYLVRNTLNLLSDVGDAGMLEEVALCLRHQDGRVRRAAVRALWKLGGPACAPPLLTVFPETDPETQVEILFGLGQVQAGTAIHVLADFARNPDVSERLRIRTLETLGQIGHPASVPVLAEFIRRKGRIFTTAEPLDVRLAAARGLVSIGTPQAVESLRKLVGEEPRNHDRDALRQVLDTPRRPQGAS